MTKQEIKAYAISVGFFTLLFIGLITQDILDKTEEVSLSRYCVDYCQKEYLKIGPTADFVEVRDHCSKFFENVSCCKRVITMENVQPKFLKEIEQFLDSRSKFYSLMAIVLLIFLLKISYDLLNN